MQQPEQPEDLLRDARYWTVPFCRAFIDRWDDEVFADQQTGNRLAAIALELVTRVERRTGERQPDLRARALAIRGSGCRATGDLNGARKYYGEARRIYEELEMPLAEADLHRRLVFLHRDLEQWEEALDCADFAAKIFLAAGELHSYGRVLVVKATVFTRMGQPVDAIPFASKALANLDYDRSPPAFYAGVHNLTVALAKTPEPSAKLLDTALRWLLEARRSGPPRGGRGTNRYSHRKRTVPDAKLRHVLGLILRRSGKTKTAIRVLQEARADLGALGLPLDVVGVALDLGELYSESGRWAKLENMASETVQLLAPFPNVSQLRKAVRQWHNAILAREQPDDIAATCRAQLAQQPHLRTAFEAVDQRALRRRLARSIEAALIRCDSLDELRRRLSAKEITVHLRSARGRRSAGIAFEVRGRRFTGHQLGRAYRLSRIKTRLECPAPPST